MQTPLVSMLGYKSYISWPCNLLHINERLHQETTLLSAQNQFEQKHQSVRIRGFLCLLGQLHFARRLLPGLLRRVGSGSWPPTAEETFLTSGEECLGRLVEGRGSDQRVSDRFVRKISERLQFLFLRGHDPQAGPCCARGPAHHEKLKKMLRKKSLCGHFSTPALVQSRGDFHRQKVEMSL